MVEANTVFIDICLRGGSIGLLLLGAIMLCRAPVSYASRLGMMLMLCTVAFVLEGVPVIEGLLPLDWFIKLCSALVIPLFWLFARAWFDDDYRPGGIDGAVAIAFVAAVLVQHQAKHRPGDPGVSDAIVYGLGTMLAVHALWLAWRDRASDLVEPRCRVRLLFVIAVALTIVWSLWSEAASRFATPLPWLSLADAAVLFLLTLGLDSALFGLAHPETFPHPARPGIAPARPEAKPSSPEEELVDPVLKHRLDQIMEHDRLYRDPELTIGQLAVRLGTAEHRLRRLINGGMGFRNFNAYLNAKRIEEVRAALADPAQTDVPILTIAMDAGFGSLPAFNRAFKAAAGETPRDFKQRMRVAS